MDSYEPAYLTLLRSGELAARVEQARAALHDCQLCAWMCRVDRTRRVGFCRTGQDAIVSSAFPHRGEEDPLSGRTLQP